MRFLVVLVLAGCTTSPAPSPTVAPTIAPSCPPLGTWTLTASASCAARPHPLVLAVHAGPPDARDPTPMFDVLAPIASGRTNDGYGYDRLLRVSNARATTHGCEMDLHIEYVGPHSALEYKVSATLTGSRIRGSGTYGWYADDCDASERACTCESPLTIEGTVH